MVQPYSRSFKKQTQRRAFLAVSNAVKPVIFLMAMLATMGFLYLHASYSDTATEAESGNSASGAIPESLANTDRKRSFRMAFLAPKRETPRNEKVYDEGLQEATGHLLPGMEAKELVFIEKLLEQPENKTVYCHIHGGKKGCPPRDGRLPDIFMEAGVPNDLNAALAAAGVTGMMGMIRVDDLPDENQNPESVKAKGKAVVAFSSAEEETEDWTEEERELLENGGPTEEEPGVWDWILYENSKLADLDADHCGIPLCVLITVRRKQESSSVFLHDLYLLHETENTIHTVDGSDRVAAGAALDEAPDGGLGIAYLKRNSADDAFTLVYKTFDASGLRPGVRVYDKVNTGHFHLSLAHDGSGAPYVLQHVRDGRFLAEWNTERFLHRARRHNGQWENHFMIGVHAGGRPFEDYLQPHIGLDAAGKEHIVLLDGGYGDLFHAWDVGQVIWPASTVDVKILGTGDMVRTPTGELAFVYATQDNRVHIAKIVESVVRTEDLGRFSGAGRLPGLAYAPDGTPFVVLQSETAVTLVSHVNGVWQAKTLDSYGRSGLPGKPPGIFFKGSLLRVVYAENGRVHLMELDRNLLFGDETTFARHRSPDMRENRS